MSIQNAQIAGYRILERIGVGGMGEVYKAFHPGLNRTAAIKVLYQKEMAERFKNEAYIQSSVSHPNIAKLYEYIPYGEHPCIIMEYVEGDSLDSYIIRKGRLNNEETEKILGQVASSLAYLHERDILHRDIKPQNFKIERDGTVKMLDFGISKNKYTPKLTQLGFVIGTTEYMAPEQFQHHVEKKSDVWSLGVMTYEMLTGHMPFDATNPISLRAKIIKANFTDPKIFVPGISSKLTTVIDKSLRINPISRISAAEIEQMINGKKQKPLPEPVNKKIAINKNWIYAAIPLIVLVIFFMTRTNSPDVVIPSKNIVVPVPPPKIEAANNMKLEIKVPSVENASIVLPDGSRHPTPFEMSGKEGEKVEFIIQADGYQDKKAFIEFTHRRSTYEYSLEKIN